LETGVSVGAYAVIEEGVRIGERSVIAAHTIIKRGTRIGKDCTIAEHVVIGGLPQDVRFAGEGSFVELEDGVTVREFATIHRATGEGQSTVVGTGSYIMAYVHVSHNCRLGEGVTLANAVQLAGHVQVGAQAFLGGSSGVHQFVRIGRLAMVGAHSYLSQDLPPFLLGAGHPFQVRGVNRVGLERAGMSPEKRGLIAKLYRLVYRDPRRRDTALAELSEAERTIPEVVEFMEFIASSRRGVRLKVGENQ